MFITLIEQPLMLEDDGRVFNPKSSDGSYHIAPGGEYDWRTWSKASFGRMLLKRLNSQSDISASVFDAGKFVSATASMTNPSSGKTISRSFIIVFDDVNSGAGNVYSSSTKWRSIGSIDQAASYITSMLRSLGNSIAN